MLNIVVIDEDVAMKSLMTEWLESAGYRVATHGNVDLVVFNMVDVKAGARAAQAVAAAYPEAALIGMSARLSDSLPPDSALAGALGVARLLAKPVARAEFLAAVAACALPVR